MYAKKSFHDSTFDHGRGDANLFRRRRSGDVVTLRRASFVEPARRSISH